jgi:hypothetical protein
MDLDKEMQVRKLQLDKELVLHFQALCNEIKGLPVFKQQ